MHQFAQFKFEKSILVFRFNVCLKNCDLDILFFVRFYGRVMDYFSPSGHLL